MVWLSYSLNPVGVNLCQWSVSGVARVVVWLVDALGAIGFVGVSWELFGCMVGSGGTIVVSRVSWELLSDSLSSGSTDTFNIE